MLNNPRKLFAISLLLGILVACGGNGGSREESENGAGQEVSAFQSTDGNFSVDFPTEPERTDEKQNFLGLEVPNVTFLAEKDGVSYFVQYIDFPSAGEFNADGALAGGVNGFVNGAGATMVSQSPGKAYGGHSSIDFVAELEGEKMRGRSFIVDRRIYNLVVGPDNEGATFRRFSDSFQLLR